MEFREIAEKLGFTEYPEALNEVYANLVDDGKPACDLVAIDQLEEKWGFFGKYYDVVKETAAAINADPIRSAWVKVGAKFGFDNPSAIARTVPVPVADGTAVTDLLPLHILLAQVPASIDEYLRRGFSEEELRKLLGGYRGGIRIVESQVGRPQVNTLYFGWLYHYVKVELFDTSGFQFELRKLPPNAIWLKNKATGEVRCVMCKGHFDITGYQVWGSKNYENPPEKFRVSFEETDEKFIGHAVYNNHVSRNPEEFSKEEWECIARPGDNCMSLHIPRKTDISMEALDRACVNAKKIMMERFPDLQGREIYCSSWLLDPRYREILGPDARMTKFMERFVKHPVWNQGTSPFGYVFPKYVEDLTTLPENTTLQRKLKKMYIEGDCIYGYAGLLV